MSNAIGTRATLRLRMGARDAYYAGGLVDGARILGLFGDVATELMVRTDGDEGLLRAYESVEFLAPVFAGDFIEVTGVLTAVGNTSRKMVLEARKVAGNLRDPELRASASGVFAEPIIVCRARATCVVSKQARRRPGLPTLGLPPASASASLTQGNVYIPPPPHTIVTPAPAVPVEVVLTAAIAGTEPSQVATEARRCRDAGAAIIHLCLPYGDGGSPPNGATANGPQLPLPPLPPLPLVEAVDAIRSATDVIVEVSIGGDVGMPLAERVASLACKPEMATLPCGTINHGDGVWANPRPEIREMARRIAAVGSAPALECFEVGHIHEALVLADEGLIQPPYRFQFVLGVPGAIDGREEVIRFMASQVPEGASWSVAAVGRLQQPMTEAAIRLGGNARVGFDHGIDIDPTEAVRHEGSAPLVAQAAAYAHGIGRKVVEPARARELLGLGGGG